LTSLRIVWCEGNGEAKAWDGVSLRVSHPDRDIRLSGGIPADKKVGIRGKPHDSSLCGETPDSALFDSADP
jgi:hypothetical protein